MKNTTIHFLIHKNCSLIEKDSCVGEIIFIWPEEEININGDKVKHLSFTNYQNDYLFSGHAWFNEKPHFFILEDVIEFFDCNNNQIRKSKYGLYKFPHSHTSTDLIDDLRDSEEKKLGSFVW